MQEDANSNPSCPKVTFSEEELRNFFRPWSKSLVVKVLEKNFSFGAVKRTFDSLWAKNGAIQVSDIANHFFLVRFEHHDDYHRAAFRGPWKIAVTRIGNCIGKTVMLDLATTEGARARYARVCVEVDISKPLLGKYMIENRTFLMEYESLENICTSCGFYGHKSAECTPAPAPASVETPKENPMTTTVEKPADDIVGEWMVVSRRSKGRVQ
ncbi:hypothetical protein LINPERHAP1_LOCUS21390 [Linum perenne]